MHSEVNYNDPDPRVNERRAVADLKKWFGARKYKTLTDQLREWPMDEEQFRAIVGISGVSGYPVGVWYRLVYKEEAR